jgi:tetratricopeptide (TPR) repeat protein
VPGCHRPRLCFFSGEGDVKPAGQPYNPDMKRTQAVVLSWLVLLVALLPCNSQSPSSREQQIEAHGRQAAEYLRQNKPDLAISEFRAIVALDPKNVDARGNLGVVLFFEGSYADAIPELRTTLKMRPTLGKIQALLGIAEKRTGDINAAHDDLEKAFPNVSDQKIQIETGMELIEIDSGTGDLDKAAAIVSVLQKLEPTDEALQYTAYRLYSDLAAQSLLSLSVVAPNSARMHQAMAHELAKQGDTVNAIDNYRAALKIDPNLPGLHFELAEMLNTLSTPEAHGEAESEYKAALEVNSLDEQAERRLGDIAFRSNDLKEASERYTRAVKLQPGDPDASIGLAKVLMAMDQPQKAEPLLEHALELDPTSPMAHYRLSTVYRQAGRNTDAQHELEQYQKYKEMKDKLQEIYHQMRLKEAAAEKDDPDPRR